MKVNSVFIAPEGEGVRIGTLQTFVRFQGCNKGKGFCRVCDTPEALSLSGGKEMSVDEIIREVKKKGINKVSLTGGCVEEQPEKELLSLINKLVKEDYFVNVEACGQYDLFPGIDIVDFISCDIKPPCTGIKQDLNIVFDMCINYPDKTQFKMIVKDKADWEFVKEVYEVMPKDAILVITPCWEVNGKLNTEFIDWIILQLKLERMNNVRLIIQQHKVIYGPKRRGV